MGKTRAPSVRSSVLLRVPLGCLIIIVIAAIMASSFAGRVTIYCQLVRRGCLSPCYLVTAAGILHDRRAAGYALIRAMQSGKPSVRVAASEAVLSWDMASYLGATDAQKLAPLLCQATTARDPKLRANAVDGLGRIGILCREIAVPAIEERLSDRIEYVRWFAVLALSDIGGPSTNAGLLRALADQSTRVRAVAASLLAQRGDQRAKAVLLECIDSQDEEGTVLPALWGIADLLGDEASPYIGKRLVDASPRLRTMGIVIVGYMRGPSSAAMLEKLLDDSDMAIRAEAAYALAKRGDGDRKVRSVLLECIGSTDCSEEPGRVARPAFWGLAELLGRDAIPYIEERIARPDSSPGLRGIGARVVEDLRRDRPRYLWRAANAREREGCEGSPTQ